MWLVIPTSDSEVLRGQEQAVLNQTNQVQIAVQLLTSKSLNLASLFLPTVQLDVNSAHPVQLFQ